MARLHENYSSEGPILSLKLLVDTEKNKVVLAEAGKDFVDVLFRLLALPMGAIVRLLEKYKLKQAATIGCFNNLYSSVSNLGIHDFMSEACKDMLLYPRYVKERQCRRLKLNIYDVDDDDDDDDGTQYIKERHESGCDEIFASEKTSFHITENMEVEFASIILARRTLLRLGYTSFDKLKLQYADVRHEQVLSLLSCLFSSETPLTDVFLKKNCSCGMTRPHDMPLPTTFVQDGDEAKTDEVVSLSVFVRKQDTKVLYAESGQDFVDLLFSFLAIPLESVWEITGDNNIELGSIGNFCKSMKSLSSSGGNAMLPWQYRLEKSLLGVCYQNNDANSQSIPRIVKRGETHIISEDLTNCIMKQVEVDLDDFKDFEINMSNSQGISLLSETEPKTDFVVEPTVPVSSGFVKRGATYMISDDLTITAANSWSAISLLKELDTNLDDMEEHVINIRKAEAINLLKASLVTSTPLTTALGNLLLKKPLVETSFAGCRVQFYARRIDGSYSAEE
ncbi:PREDICTED: uncharacterized protein LOC104759168 [Camelina sativa]|uniref:Uncharacterized protein LOC104759168 n=1 Tax=Camelina sativa TaxID=90675 RepID=A0ABM0X4C1_CAMSA|nr:PREDICTED: uncharacterized protein LOC104759168 [Camelina sativa]